MDDYPGDDETKKVLYDSIYGFNKGELCTYEKYTYINIAPGDLPMLKEEGIPEEGIYYDPDELEEYTIQNNIVTFTYDSDDEEITVTMKFAITGKTATIIVDDSDGYKATIEAVKVDASVVKDAKVY